MLLRIVRVNETLFAGEAHAVTVPAISGEMTVLGGHMPVVTTLRQGVVLVFESKDAAAKEFEIAGGVLEVTPTHATILL